MAWICWTIATSGIPLYGPAEWSLPWFVTKLKYEQEHEEWTNTWILMSRSTHWNWIEDIRERKTMRYPLPTSTAQIKNKQCQSRSSICRMIHVWCHVGWTQHNKENGRHIEEFEERVKIASELQSLGRGTQVYSSVLSLDRIDLLRIIEYKLNGLLKRSMHTIYSI